MKVAWLDIFRFSTLHKQADIYWRFLKIAKIKYFPETETLDDKLIGGF